MSNTQTINPLVEPQRPDHAEDEKARKRAARRARRLRRDADWFSAYDERADADDARADHEKELRAIDRLEDAVADSLTRERDYTAKASTAARGGAHDEARKFDEIARKAFERRQVDEARLEEALDRVHVHEPAPYSAGSPHSYFADLAAVHVRGGTASASDRLQRHARSVALDASGGTARARRAIHDIARRDLGARETSVAEVRAMTSGATSGGSLVSPEYLVDQWAKFRSYVPALADACQQADLPSFGLEVHVPAVESADAVSVQAAEGTAVTSTAFTTGYRTVAVQTFAGSTTISQQLLDRSGPGVSFDQVVYAQLRQSLTQQVSAAVASAMIAAATKTVARTAAFSVPDFWSDLSQAALSLEDTAGTLLFATHAFLTPGTFRFAASQVDSQNRPLWTPDPGSRPDPQTGDTGYSVAGTSVFVDGAIPANGSNARMIVANPAHGVLLLRGEPIVQVFPEPDAEDLNVIARLYQYAAVVVRHPSAASVVTGSAYAAAPTFA